jgi:hypothetical protein
VKLSVVCETCANAEVASCESDDPQAVGILLVACHATNPHSGNHRLKPIIGTSSAPLPDQAREIELKCICRHPGCPAPQPVNYKVPAYIASAMVISHHAQHEGHPLEIWLEGKKIHPPT